MEKIREKLFKLVGNEYQLKNVETFKDTQNRNKRMLELTHSICGKTFKMREMNFFGKKEHHLANRCPFCSHGHKRKSTKEFKEQLFLLVGNEYKMVSDEYLGNKKNITFLHLKCMQEFQARPDNFFNGTRCPHCKINSKGEAAIREYFKRNNTEFLTEVWFKNCRDKWPLPFDFAIFKDNKFCMLIEYHGIQHFQETGKSPFATESLKKHDKMKLKFCKENSIPLEIISYKEIKNIDTYLEKIISSTIPLEVNLASLGVGPSGGRKSLKSK